MEGMPRALAERTPPPAHPIQREEEFFATIVGHATDMISLHGIDGVYLYASPACERLLGHRSEDLVGRSAYAFFHPEDREAVEEVHRSVLEVPEVQTLRYRIRRRDGRYIWFETTTKTIRDPATGEPQQILAVSRDVSRDRELEDQLRQARDDLRREQQRRAVLLRDVAHDIGSALSPVRINAATLRALAAKGRPTPVELIEQMVFHCDFAAHLVDDLRDVIRMHEHGLVLHKEPLGLGAFVREVTEAHRGVFEARDLRLDVRAEEGPRVEADPHRVRQVMMNLLSNARKFTPRGGSVTVAVETHEDRAVVAVEDTGRGLAGVDTGALFRPYFQAHGPGPEEPGTGLGLSICRAIIEGHGGRIWAEKRSNGARFAWSLPVLHDA